MKTARSWIIALLLAVAAQAAPKPKLVVAIIVDQFRYDYMTRFDGDYHEGLRKLHDSGAFFTDGHEAHFPTVTAVGHAAFLTGSIPAIDGIVGNEWFDRETGKTVTSVSDDATKLVGGNGGTGSSPRRLVVTTLGDEIKATGLADTEVIGISLKDRAAILPAAMPPMRLTGSTMSPDNSSPARITCKICRRGCRRSTKAMRRKNMPRRSGRVFGRCLRFSESRTTKR